MGWRGRYVGLDSSAALLALAGEQSRGLAGIAAAFVEADLLQEGWPRRLPGPPPDAAVALAVLHHIPGREQRRAFLASAAASLAPGGYLVASTWQFMSTPRLRDHILPWERVGLRQADVETGDYLLSWGQGAAGERYCAAIDAAELQDLAAGASLATVTTCEADGYEGNLNLYGVFRRAEGQ